MTEKSQHRVPHVVFIIFIVIPRGAERRARERGRGVGPIHCEPRYSTEKETSVSAEPNSTGSRRIAMDTQQKSTLLHWWPEFPGCRGQSPSGCGIARHEMRWYSRNNRRLWCFKAAQAEAVEVCMSSVDTAFLHSLTTQTDGLSVTFFPPLQCNACHKEFVNRKGRAGRASEKESAGFDLGERRPQSYALGQDASCHP